MSNEQQDRVDGCPPLDDRSHVPPSAGHSRQHSRAGSITSIILPAIKVLFASSRPGTENGTTPGSIQSSSGRDTPLSARTRSRPSSGADFREPLHVTMDSYTGGLEDAQSYVNYLFAKKPWAQLDIDTYQKWREGKLKLTLEQDGTVSTEDVPEEDQVPLCSCSKRYGPCMTHGRILPSDMPELMNVFEEGDGAAGSERQTTTINRETAYDTWLELQDAELRPSVQYIQQCHAPADVTSSFPADRSYCKSCNTVRDLAKAHSSA